MGLFDLFDKKVDSGSEWGAAYIRRNKAGENAFPKDG